MSATLALSFHDLKKNLKKDFSGFRSMKIAVLGDSATQFLVQALRGYGYERKYDFDIFESDYDQIFQQISDGTSDFYTFNADTVVLLQSSEKLLDQFYKQSAEAKRTFAEDTAATLKKMLATVMQQNARCRIIMANFPEIDDSVFGNSANKYDISFIYAVRKLNVLLMDMARAMDSLSVVDLCTIQSRHGRKFFHDPRLYVDASMAYTLDALPIVAKNIVDIIDAAQGAFKKCLVMDLDNTLWGGIIGDDGLEKIEIGDLGIGKSYTALQKWVKQLRLRGILLAVCSKNDESVAKEVFEKHPDMVLRLDDISVFVANWNNKADNIRAIQETLNIGLDSMVFIDDNSFERAMVRANLPEVTVPEMPEDPVEYLDYLRDLNLFESGTLTEQDFERTRMIQDRVKLKEFESSFTNESEFLRSLSMVGTISSFNAYNIPRVAQLSQRSNQYNLRTVRYNQDDISHIAAAQSYIGLAFSLKDKLSDHGLISAVVLEIRGDALFIENWFMSCRVLKRGVECLVLNTVLKAARERGMKTVVGEYLPTPKNALVKDHYRDLGFKKISDTSWSLDVNNFSDRQNYIQTEQAA